MPFPIYKLEKQNLKSMSYKTVYECVAALGITTHGGSPCFGVTVAIPSNLIIPWPDIYNSKSRNGSVKLHKLRYSSMTNEQQYMFLIKKYIPSVITPFIERGLIVPELTKANNIHLHLICQDESIKTPQDMSNLQRLIFQSAVVQKISSNNFRLAINLNYIHFLDNVLEWLKYLSKANIPNLKFYGFKNWTDNMLEETPVVEDRGVYKCTCGNSELVNKIDVDLTEDQFDSLCLCCRAYYWNAELP